MANDLIVNPFLQFFRAAADETGLVLSAPVRGSGLQKLALSPSEHPHLFELFTELQQTSPDLLDVDDDLDDEERDTLVRSGVLVASVTPGDRPLFSCHLDDIGEFQGAFDHDELVVNPSFRFEPFDLTRFVEMIHERRLSPHQPSVWIKTPVTDIDIGYWISHEVAAVVSGFVAGGPVIKGISETLTRKLLTAGTVTTVDTLRTSSAHMSLEIDGARKDFAAKAYTIFRGILPAEQMTAMREYYRQYVDGGFMPFGDGQVGRRYYANDERFAAFLHAKLARLVSLVVGEEVKLSYVFAASYIEGAVLTPHTDRHRCEYSISFQVDYQPETPDHVSPWPIYVEPLRHSGELPVGAIHMQWEDLESVKSTVKPQPIHLARGDGLIYKGRELIHYRHPLPRGHRSTSLFFHFVRMDFAGDLD